MRRPQRQETSPAKRSRSGPRTFDAFELVQQRGTLCGAADAAQLPRVADALAEPGGRVEYAIQGTSDEADRPALDLAIDGELFLTCQRCLQPMRWIAAQRITVLLARDARELALLDDSDEREVVLADAPLDPLALVEDELVLTMPYAPRHSPDEAPRCVPAHGDAPQRPASPFGALAGLRDLPEPAKGKRSKR
jgi:uncharacterized protein